MICKKCGNNMSSNQTVCSKCGAKSSSKNIDKKIKRKINRKSNNYKNKYLFILPFILIFISIFIIGIGTYFLMFDDDSNSVSDDSNDVSEEIRKEPLVENFKGYVFTIPVDYDSFISMEGAYGISKGKASCLINIDSSTYEDNYQYIISQYPDLSTNLEMTIKDRNVSVVRLKNNSVLFFTKASDNEIFEGIITSTDEKVSVDDVANFIEILNNTVKDENTSIIDGTSETNSFIADNVSKMKESLN